MDAGLNPLLEFGYIMPLAHSYITVYNLASNLHKKSEQQIVIRAFEIQLISSLFCFLYLQRSLKRCLPLYIEDTSECNSLLVLLGTRLSLV